MDQYQFAVTVSCLAIALVLATWLFVRTWRACRALRRRNAELTGRLRIRDEELSHLVDVRLPELMDHPLDRSVALSGPLHERELRETVFEQAVQRVMELFADCVRQSKNRADQSAKATLRAMMRTVQSLANEQQLDISTMQERHDHPDVLEDLLKIDHMNAQIGRRAQATAVLCGSWPGQQRSASSLGDVARGATSRVRDYLRVKIPTQVNVAVVGRAVEPVVLALAELLDNATRHSAPDTSVEVNFHTTHNGVAITIDDAGVAMDAEELAQAGRLLSGDHQVYINRLGDPPQIGFAAIGVLARRYGFSVSVDTRSPYGGVRAVLFLPTPLLTRTSSPPETVVATPAARAAGVATTPPRPPRPPRPVDRPVWPERAEGPGPFEPAMRVNRNAVPAPVPPVPVERPDPVTPVERPDPVAPAMPLTAGGLPKRRRAVPGPDGGRTGPGSMVDPQPVYEQRGPHGGPPGPPPARATGRPGRHARQSAAGMGAWQRGTRSGRAATPGDREGNQTKP